MPKPVRDPQRPARDVLMDGVLEEDEWKLLRELNKLGLGEELLDRPFDPPQRRGADQGPAGRPVPSRGTATP